MGMRAALDRTPNGVRVVLRVLRRRPHRKLAPVAVILRAQQSGPTM